MRLLFIDIDTLRPDHMGCYGYGRETTPAMDEVAREGCVFDRYYTPNAPCLPSRAALVSGRYGIHNGVVGHGGTAADMKLQGYTRGFKDDFSLSSLFFVFKKAGWRTASVSSFAERHSAWWFNAGFDETYNLGKSGNETAEVVTAAAKDWIERHADRDDWLLHVHYWDPHTPYRTPQSYGNPFENVPLADPWITPEIFRTHLAHVGPHSAREINMWDDHQNPALPRHPGAVLTMEEMKRFIDNYDTGIRYTDDNVRVLLDLLKERGIYEDTAVIITSDHGENIGELGLYAEHGTADEITCRIPMIVRWPGKPAGIRDEDFHQNIDLAPTAAELLGVEKSPRWDGESYAPALDGKKAGRDHVIIGQCAHVLQRSARWDKYLYIRSPHTGYHQFDEEMLFDLEADPHETTNIVALHPDLAAIGSKMILDWEYDMMKTADDDRDPMWTVLREGGPYHSRGYLTGYVARLRETGREEGADWLEARYPEELKAEKEPKARP